MKNIHYRHNVIVLLLFTSVTLYSCKKDIQPVVQPAVTTSSDASDLAIINLPGRTLAANCFQCHGTNGHAQELGIAGMSSSEIIGEINEMKNENPGDNIMNVHAMAYTDAEMKLIADFFSKQ